MNGNDTATTPNGQAASKMYCAFIKACRLAFEKCERLRNVVHYERVFMMMRMRCIVQTVVILLVVSLWAAPCAAGFEVYVNALATTESGTMDGDTQSSTTLTYLHTYVSSYGGFGSVGIGEAKVDIINSSVSTYAYGHSAYDDSQPPQAGYGNGRGGTAGFTDVATFTVRAGTYTSGATARLDGHMSGTLSGGGSHEYLFQLGGVSGQFQGTLTSTGSYSQSFTLLSELVAPGTTLLVDTQFQRNVLAQMRSAASAENGSTITVDFYSTGEFTGLTVPEGVTWQTDSGSNMPEPATMTLLVLGGLAVLRRRRR